MVLLLVLLGLVDQESCQAGAQLQYNNAQFNPSTTGQPWFIRLHTYHSSLDKFAEISRRDCHKDYKLFLRKKVDFVALLH
jgi:hypothetical protein